MGGKRQIVSHRQKARVREMRGGGGGGGERETVRERKRRGVGWGGERRGRLCHIQKARERLAQRGSFKVSTKCACHGPGYSPPSQ